MKLIFNPTLEQTAETVVDTVVREDGIYTLNMLDGTTKSALLVNPDDRDVMALIAAVKKASL